MTLSRKEAVEKLMEVYIENSDDTLVLFETEAMPLITDIFNKVPEDDQGLVYHMFQEELRIEMAKRGVDIQELNKDEVAIN